MAARSAVVTAIGLTLAAINPSILIILPYYGLLFLLAIPVLGWSARRMALLAALAAVTTPLVSHLLRMGARPAGVANVTWDWVRNDLADAFCALFSPAPTRCSHGRPICSRGWRSDGWRSVANGSPDKSPWPARCSPCSGGGWASGH